jgi:hypothetical protein
VSAADGFAGRAALPRSGMGGMVPGQEATTMAHQNRDEKTEQIDTDRDPVADSRNRQDHRHDTQDEDGERPVRQHSRQNAQMHRQNSMHKREREGR